MASFSILEILVGSCAENCSNALVFVYSSRNKSRYTNWNCVILAVLIGPPLNPSEMAEKSSFLPTTEYTTDVAGTWVSAAKVSAMEIILSRNDGFLLYFLSVIPVIKSSHVKSSLKNPLNLGFNCDACVSNMFFNSVIFVSAAMVAVVYENNCPADPKYLFRKSVGFFSYLKLFLYASISWKALLNARNIFSHSAGSNSKSPENGSG